MSRAVCPVLMLAVLAVMAPQAVAAPVVTLSSPDDLTQLMVGDTVAFDVNSRITGLESGPNEDFVFRLYTAGVVPLVLFPDLGPQ